MLQPIQSHHRDCKSGAKKAGLTYCRIPAPNNRVYAMGEKKHLLYLMKCGYRALSRSAGLNVYDEDLTKEGWPRALGYNEGRKWCN